PEERPEERNEFTIKGDLLQHVQDNRGSLVKDALTIVRAYVCAGHPAQQLMPMDYPAWSKLIRGAVHWVSGVDPCETKQERISEDAASQQLAGLLTGWESLCESANKTGSGMTAAEAIRWLSENPTLHEELRSILMEWSRDGQLPGPRIVGN